MWEMGEGKNHTWWVKMAGYNIVIYDAVLVVKWKSLRVVCVILLHCYGISLGCKITNYINQLVEN